MILLNQTSPSSGVEAATLVSGKIVSLGDEFR
jgi:hypothetical protein